jgi:hypothetical protein
MAGRMAMRSLARTFELWLAVGKAVKTLRARADKIGGRKTFQRLLDQNGFQSLPAATITRLLRIVDRLAEVDPWHEGLDEKQQREWYCATIRSPQDRRSSCRTAMPVRRAPPR